MEVAKLSQLIRTLFKDLTPGPLEKLSVDNELRDAGFNREARDALFLVHSLGQERSLETTGWPTNVLSNSFLAGPYIVRQAPQIRIAADWNFTYRYEVPSPLGPNDIAHLCGRPECKPVTRREFPDRVILGESAQCAFARWRVMDAFLWQYADVPAGTILTLQADVHAWCSDSDDTTRCDGEFYFRLGIDNKGGFEPLVTEGCPSMMWSNWTRATNAYQTIEMQALAMAPTVTVYVNFWNKYRYSHNDAYIDSVRLLVDRPIPDPKPPSGACVCWEDLALVFRDITDALDERAAIESTS